MSDYFDHVKCHSCKAQLDPERIETVEGRMVCPACGNDLGLTDLFGVKAAFLEEDGPQMTLEDLVPSSGKHFDSPWASPDLGDYAQKNARYEWERPPGQPQPLDDEPEASWQAPKRARGYTEDELPAGAVRARSVQPPPAKESPAEPARRRRFAGPGDAQPPASANQMVHVPSEEFEEAPPKPASALDALRDEKAPDKKKRRRF